MGQLLQNVLFKMEVRRCVVVGGRGGQEGYVRHTYDLPPAILACSTFNPPHCAQILPMENPRGRDLVESGKLCERKNGRGVDPNRSVVRQGQGLQPLGKSLRGRRGGWGWGRSAVTCSFPCGSVGSM